MYVDADGVYEPTSITGSNLAAYFGIQSCLGERMVV